MDLRNFLIRSLWRTGLLCSILPSFSAFSEEDPLRAQHQFVYVIEKPHWTAMATRIIASVVPVLLLPWLLHRLQSTGEENKAVYLKESLHKLKDFVGRVPQELQVLVEYINSLSVRQALLYHGVSMSKGCILYGKPGVGKTFLAKCIAGELGVACIAITAADIFNSKWMGSAVRNVTALLEEARQEASHNKYKTCIIIIDEAESLLNSRLSADSPIAQEYNNAVNVFLSGVDGINTSHDDILLYTIACTNSEMADLDPAFKRSGRFEAQIEIMPPNEEETLAIFQHYLKKFKVLPSIEFSLMIHQQTRIAETAQALYIYYLRKNGYLSAVDIKRAIEKALVSVHLTLGLTFYEGALQWWKNIYRYILKRESYNYDLYHQIDMLRNSGELFDRVLSEINTSLNYSHKFEPWHSIIV